MGMNSYGSVEIENQFILLLTNESESHIIQKNCKGELTMHRYFFNVVNNKSAMVMPKHNVGLTLSYSFLE